KHAMRFLSRRQICHPSRRGDPATVRALFRYLRGAGIVATPVLKGQPSAIDRILTTFEEYLITERGLKQATVSYYRCEVGQFLSHRFKLRDPLLSKLSAKDVPGDLREECSSVYRRPMKGFLVRWRSVMWSGELFRGLPSIPLSKVPICYAIRWPQRCFVRAHLWRRLARSSGTDRPIRLRSTPRWI